MSTAVFSTLGASNHSEGIRQAEDFYASDSRIIKHLLKKEPQLRNRDLKVLEPSAGNGVLGDAWYEEVGSRMDMYDIVSRREDVIQANYYETDFSNKYDLIITNPPYMVGSKTKKGLTDFILKALNEVKVGGSVCLFLKTLHLESMDRYERIYKDYPPSKVYVYAPRINCYKNDDRSLPQGAISYAWFVWYKVDEASFEKPTLLDWVSER